MKSIHKIKGYVASKKNKIVFLYRQSNKVTYLASLDYTKGKEAIKIGLQNSIVGQEFAGHQVSKLIYCLRMGILGVVAVDLWMGKLFLSTLV